MHEMTSHPFQTRGHSSGVLTAIASQGVGHGADPAISSATGASSISLRCHISSQMPQLMFRPIPGRESETHETNRHQPEPVGAAGETPTRVEQGEIQAGVYSPMRCGGHDDLM
jgi:hypothetical protein